MTLKGGTRWVNFFKQISLITLVPFDLERPNSAGNTWGNERISRGSATPPPLAQGSGAPASSNFGDSYLRPAPIWFDLYKSDLIRQGNICGEGHVSWAQPLPVPRGGIPALPNFWGLPLFISTPCDGERPNSAH